MKKILILFFIIFCFSASAVEKKTNFSIEIFENAKADGKTIVINSYNVSCGTCARQTKILDKAGKEFKEILFLSYEHSKNKNIAKKLGIKTIWVSSENDQDKKTINFTNQYPYIDLKINDLTSFITSINP